MSILVELKRTISKKDTESAMSVVAGEMVESYVSFNVGKVLDIWLSLVKALSSLRRTADGDAKIGLEVLHLLKKETSSVIENRIPNDEIARYVVRQLANSQVNSQALLIQLDTATNVLMKI